MFGSFAYAEVGSVLKDLSKHYRDAALVEMNVEKRVKSELLGKQTIYQGKIFLMKGKFRWENTIPEKTLLVFDGNTIWSEQTPPKEFGGPVQVAKGKVDRKTSSQVLISSLLGAELEKNFKVLKNTKEGDLLLLELAPVKPDPAFKVLNVKIDSSEKTLEEVAYEDDIGNLTTLKFSGIQFQKKSKPQLFKYQPPKGAQVTDL